MGSIPFFAVEQQQMTLNDRDIREPLIRRLQSFQSKPKAVVEELHVHNGTAIADVVTLHSEAHCYEIKGCNDRIERILKQGEIYNRSFRKITLVTTDRHLEKALSITPSFWGIMVAYRYGTEIRIKHVRGAKSNLSFDKESAALTLWKSEMLSILDDNQFRKYPRKVLARSISEKCRESDLSSRICELLIQRYSR